MLAFIGSLIPAERVGGSGLESFAASLVWFAWGVAAAVIGMALAYLANFFGGAALMAHEKCWDHPYVRDGAASRGFGIANVAFIVLAVVAGIASIVLFIVGMLDVEGSIGLLNLSQT